MALQIVYETHSWSEDNERGVATGWLPGRLSPRGRELAAELGAAARGRHRRGDHVIDGTPLEDLLAADFGWREGWEYRLEEGAGGEGGDAGL